MNEVILQICFDLELKVPLFERVLSDVEKEAVMHVLMEGVAPLYFHKFHEVHIYRLFTDVICRSSMHTIVFSLYSFSGKKFIKTLSY